jgi:tRNA(Ile)-lysidine synthase
VILCYVDHGLRAAAKEEGTKVVALAEAHGAIGVISQVKIDRKRGGGLEEAARAARYDALAACAREHRADVVLLGHTASDQAETVLARLLRGAGAVGLAGIPARRDHYLRPLLAFDRADIQAYLTARGLTASRDASNDDPAFLRNRLRHRILPILRTENPNVDRTLARSAEALREVADALDWAADQAATQIALRRTPGAVRASAPALAQLPPAVAKRLVSRLAGDLGVSLEAQHLDRIVALCARPARGTKAISLPRLRGRREYDDLCLDLRGPRPPTSINLHITGADPPYLVRAWQPGDRMKPARLGGKSKKLQDLYADRKIPREDRRDALVVVREKDGAIVWAQYIGEALDSRVEVALTGVSGTAITGGYSRKP